MSPTTSPTPAQKVTVLKHLINDRNTEFITAATGLTHDQVNDIKRDHGYPDNDKMQWAIDILNKKADELPAAAIRPPRPAVPDPSVSVTTTPPATGTAAGPLVEQLIVRAKGSTKASTRKLGERVQTLVEQLRTTVEAEERAARATAQAAAADAARKAEIAKLEAKLAELRGTPVKAKSATSTSDNGESKRIRAWAADNGVECPKVGRVPTAVREAYQAAHAEDAA